MNYLNICKMKMNNGDIITLNLKNNYNKIMNKKL